MAPVAKVGLVSNVVKAWFSKVSVKQKGLTFILLFRK